MRLHHRCRGFVLPVTVIILAFIAVGVAMMAHRSDELRQLVLAIEADRLASRQVAEATAEALFLSGALYRRSDSMGEIKLDGRAYLSATGPVVSYADTGALLGLRRAPRQELHRLLLALGFKDVLQIDQLADVLLDYTDKDDLEQLNGAEAAAYRSAGLPIPRNGRLLTATELRRLLVWRDLPEDVLQRVLAHVHTGTQRSLNRYTVKAPVLAAITGLDPSVAAEIVRSRPPEAPLDIDALPTVTASNFLSAGRYINVPASELLVTICPLRVAWCQHLSISSTGESAFAPWHVTYSYRLARSAPLPDASKLPPLPNQLPDKPPPPVWSPLGFDPPGGGPSS